MHEFWINVDETGMPDGAGERIDVFLVRKSDGKTRSAIQKLIADGHVLVNDRPIDKNYKLRINDHVVLEQPEPKVLDMLPENIPLDVVYEDDDLLVVNKPKGMVVHPAVGNDDGTMVNALLYHCKDSLSGINGVIRPGIVHRIDKDTSGLLIVAKNDRAHVQLAEQIEQHSFCRVYQAVVYGNIKEEEGTIETLLGRHPADRKKMAVLSCGGRKAITHFKVMERFGSFTHLELRLETGRTHQIRVHMASIGHPVAGDPIYGPKKVLTFLDGQCLHAKTIGFVHPTTKEYVEFDSPLPEIFRKFLDKLRKEAGVSYGEEGFSELLIATDCDGTLLKDDKTISEINSDAIRKFIRAGGHFTIATGRSIPTASNYLKMLNITMPVVLYNGAMVYDPVLQEPLWIASLPESAKVALPFVETKYKGIVGVEILTAHKLCAVMYNDVVDRHLNGIYPVPHERCKWAEIAGDTWIKVLFAAEAKFLPQLEKDLESLSIEGIRLVHSEPEMIEMLPIHVSKGDALKRICNITGLNLSKATAIGDYYNDLEMIQEAHFGVAVENACEEIKAEADLIVGTNEQDAVAETIAYVMKNHPHIF